MKKNLPNASEEKITCALCEKKVDKLCNSHILPELLYKKTYDSIHRAHGIKTDGSKKYVQNGIKENLLCESCEQKLSTYEKHFQKNFISNNTIPDIIDADSVTIRIDDPRMFKLFHLANIFRASMSKDPTFDAVNLGPHLPIIRKMLLEGADNDNYLVFGSVLFNKDRNVPKNIVIFPQLKKFNAHSIYESVYAGCVWHVKVSSHHSRELKEISINSPGQHEISAGPWEDLHQLEVLQELLNTNKPKTSPIRGGL